MLAQWMEALFGKMRANKVKDAELAEEVGWHPKYLSAVLNGHKTPAGAEEKLTAALRRIVERKRKEEERTAE